MYAQGFGEYIDSHTQQETKEHRKPCRCFKRQQNNKENIDVRIEITTQLNIIESKYLQEDQQKKAKDIPRKYINHFPGSFLPRSVHPA